jgi:hypothetical protein
MLLRDHGPQFTQFETRSVVDDGCLMALFEDAGDSILVKCAATVIVYTWRPGGYRFIYFGDAWVNVTVQRINGDLRVTGTQAFSDSMETGPQ